MLSLDFAFNIDLMLVAYKPLGPTIGPTQNSICIASLLCDLTVYIYFFKSIRLIVGVKKPLFSVDGSRSYYMRDSNCHGINISKMKQM